MSEEILINITPMESRVAVVENGVLQEVHVERTQKRGIVGNIYKGKVVRVLPGMQAAFVDIGHERAAFLYAGDFYKSKNTDIDTDEDEDQDEALEYKERKRHRHYREKVPPIATLVREGQDILVQVAKGPIGTKG